jgi:hypothetical protein
VKLKEDKAFFFAAKIMRASREVLRQGTVNAADAREAIDKVYLMGCAVWKRSVITVTILDVYTGEIEATSTMADRVATKLLNAPVEQKDGEEEPLNGFTPWSDPLPPDPRPTYFTPSTIGTFFQKKCFSVMHHNVTKA